MLRETAEEFLILQFFATLRIWSGIAAMDAVMTDEGMAHYTSSPNMTFD